MFAPLDAVHCSSKSIVVGAVLSFLCDVGVSEAAAVVLLLVQCVRCCQVLPVLLVPLLAATLVSLLVQGVRLTVVSVKLLFAVVVVPLAVTEYRGYWRCRERQPGLIHGNTPWLPISAENRG